MANKVKRGGLNYFVWLIIIVVGLACISASILLFNPNKDVFGIGLKYISHLGENNYNTIKVDDDEKDIISLDIDKFNFNSTYADFTITKDTNYSQITFNMDRKVNGFSNDKDYKGCYLDFKYEDKTLTVDVVAPNLWLPFGKTINIVVYFPKTYDLSEKAFNFNTTEGSITPALNNSAANITIKDLSIKTTSGKITLNNNLNVVSGNVNIKSESSKTLVYCDISSNLNYITKSGKLSVENISGNLNIDTDALDVKCGEIGGNISYASRSGYIRVDKLGKDASTGNFSAEADKMHIADILIGEMTGNIDIPNGEKSNITISKILGEALIETTSGYIKIENANNNVSLKTTSGNIWLTQTSASAKSELETTSGKITTNLTQVKTVDLKSEKGLIEIHVATDLQFKLNYSTEKEIRVSWIVGNMDKTGTLIVGGNAETTNVINATTKYNKIEISDGFALN